jgi:hypothetical protein
VHDQSTTAVTPPRPDARLLGAYCVHIEAIIAPHSAARYIFVVEDVVRHYREKHKDQFDIDLAEAMVPSIIADPHAVYQGKKRTTLVFTGDFEDRYVLVVPIKCLTEELWQETLFIYRREDFEGRGWVKRGLLYRRQG